MQLLMSIFVSIGVHQWFPGWSPFESTPHDFENGVYSSYAAPLAVAMMVMAC